MKEKKLILKLSYEFNGVDFIEFFISRFCVSPGAQISRILSNGRYEFILKLNN